MWFPFWGEVTESETSILGASWPTVSYPMEGSYVKELMPLTPGSDYPGRQLPCVSLEMDYPPLSPDTAVAPAETSGFLCEGPWEGTLN